MKLMMSRNRSEFGGIFRRFREMAAYCEGRLDMVGVLPIGDRLESLTRPVPTFVYPKSWLSDDMEEVENVDELLFAGDRMITALATDIARERPDALLVVDTGLRSSLALAAALRARCPATTIVAGLAHAEARYDPAGASRVAALSERYCLEHSHRLVFPSALAAREALAAHPGMAPYEVVPNGVPEALTHWPRPEVPTDPRVGAIMRLAGHKDPRAFLEATERLASHGYGADLVTDLGPDPTNAIQVIPPRIRTLPQMTRLEALAEFFGSCRAILALSRFETFGNVPMEAVARGVPAVVTDRMGVAERFRDLGLEGLIVPVGDIDAVVDAVFRAREIPDPVRSEIAATQTWGHTCGRLLEIARRVHMAA